MLCPIFYLGLLSLLAQLSYSLPGLRSIAIRNRIEKRQSTPSTIVSGGTTWLYRGCAFDGGDRALTGFKESPTTNTPATCVATCLSQGFTYAGTEYGLECYCGNALLNGYGTSAPSDDCKTPCSGDSSLNCGGPYRLSLYQQVATPTSSSAAPSPSASGIIVSGTSRWISDGCRYDGGDRALTGSFQVLGNNSPATCIATCLNQGYALAGLEYWTQCYCGNALLNGQGTVAPAGDCDAICTGDDAYTCGGAYRLNLYRRIDQVPPTPSSSSSAAPPGPTSGTWSLRQGGDTGVSAMQLVVIDENHAVIIDKVEANPLTINGHPAWSSVYDFGSDTVQPIDLITNSFCATGSFLSNGTLINVGGNPIIHPEYGTQNGFQAIRVLEGCTGGSCRFIENVERLRMATPRWYPSSVRMDDGSIFIAGGSHSGQFINDAGVNVPTLEFWPPKANFGNGLAIDCPFLHDTLNSNLFPILILLPDGRIFMAANNGAMIYDWKSRTEQRLPNIPNGVRFTYPMTGTAVLLPLSEINNWQAEVLICGGSTIDDHLPGDQMSSQTPASDQCSRMVLTPEGIARGWQVETMPSTWMMPDNVILPDGKILFINGCATGVAGYGNVANQIGQSNCDNPIFKPALYDPAAPSGSRFSSEGLPTSPIARVYHSVATLTSDGRVFIAGSNPNDDVRTVRFATEFRSEWLSPAYLSSSLPRPTYSGLPDTVDYGSAFTLAVTIGDASDVRVALMDFGFSTHSVHMDSRLVYLTTTISADRKTLNVMGPPSATIYPPGPGFLFVVADNIPSLSKRFLVGNGQGPPVDQAAIDNLLANSSPCGQGNPLC